MCVSAQVRAAGGLQLRSPARSVRWAAHAAFTVAVVLIGPSHSRIPESRAIPPSRSDEFYRLSDAVRSTTRS